MRQIDSLVSAGRLTLLPTNARATTVWWCELEAAVEQEAGYARWLSADERARADRFSNTLVRRRFVTGRAMLRVLLARQLGIDPAEVALEQGPRGRPQLHACRPLDFSLSHTASVALIAITENETGRWRIGVDIEQSGRRIEADRLAHKFLTSAEARSLATLPSAERPQRFLRYWTYKEAMSKATGDGLSAPFRHLNIELDGPRLSEGPFPYLPAWWTLHDVEVPDGYVAALAMWSRA